MAAEPLRRVLVTGGAGYIGSHIVLTLLLTRRYKVISVDNHHNSYPESLNRVQEIARSSLPSGHSEQDLDSTKVDAVSADLTIGDQIRNVFEKFGKGGVWGVIHVAAYKAVGESSEIPLAYYSNNVSATVLLSQIMHEYNCTRMVYSSSATVYGTPPIVPIPETTPLKADSVYGRTKVMCEMILQDLCHAEPDKWRVISLRYFNPAGAHPSGRMGEDPRGRPGNLLPLLSQMAIGRVKDAELKVFGNDFPTPDGTCVRDYLHVMDLASGHLLALDALVDASHPAFQNLPDRAKYKAYNLGKGKGQSVFNIVDAMRKATGVDFKTRVIGRRLGDVPDLTADPTLAEQELGFHAEQELDTMCRDLWNWQSSNPEGYATPQPPSSPPGAPLQDWVNVPSSLKQGTPSSTVVEDADESVADAKGGKTSTSKEKRQQDNLTQLTTKISTTSMDPPVLPTEREIFDPRTPAHYMTPAAGNTPDKSRTPVRPMTPVAANQE